MFLYFQRSSVRSLQKGRNLKGLFPQTLMPGGARYKTGYRYPYQHREKEEEPVAARVTWMIVNVLGLDMLGHVVLLLAEVRADGALVLSCRQPGCPHPLTTTISTSCFKYSRGLFWPVLRNRIPDRIEKGKVGSDPNTIKTFNEERKAGPSF